MTKPRQEGVPEQFAIKSRGIRLQKALADAGVASRRECESMIEHGLIKVNGEPVTGLPAWVDPETDYITVEDRPIRRPAKIGQTQRKIYIMLNKPRNVVTTTSDPQGRSTVTDLVLLPGKPRLFPIGRLDAESTGLILMTNDGTLTQRISHPSYQVPKTYHVSVRGHMSDDDIESLKKGMILAPRHTGAVPRRASMERIKLLSRGKSRGKEGGERTRLAVTLTEGQNREIRRLLAKLGYKVRRLERVAIGPLLLKGLGPGQWRKLTTREVAMLQRF
jgi:pseudouridine synthase